MEVIDTAQLPWDEIASSHRAGSIAFKHVFFGKAGSPDNYELMVARLDHSYETPRHRHPYDQVRLTLAGSFNVGPGTEMEAGDVGFFPEGAYYGPQKVRSSATVLTLQGGGASGLGFLGLEEVKAGQSALLAEGEFRGGVFHRTSGVGRRAQDGYEAVWERVSGRPLAYPSPRYEHPIIMHPQNFRWCNLPGRIGLQHKPLGVFTERGMQLEFFRARPGASLDLRCADGHAVLAYVLDGGWQAEAHALPSHSAARLGGGERVLLTAVDTAMLFVMHVPAVGSPAATSNGGDEPWPKRG